MNIELWKSIAKFVAIDKYPDLPCPYCAKEALVFDASSITHRLLSENFKEKAQYHSRHYKGLQERERLDSEMTGELVGKAFEAHPLIGILGVFGAAVYETEKVKYQNFQFTGFMCCKECGDYVSVNGLSQQYVSNNPEEQKRVLLKVERFSLSLPLFPINAAVPYGVEKELLDAFSYYHFDPCSSANKLRRSMERFCDSLGAEGKMLDKKIKSLPAKYEVEAEYLNTLRFVGNEGSHADGVDEVDLLHAFEIFEDVLEVFVRLEKLNKLKKSHDALNNKFDKKPVAIS